MRALGSLTRSLGPFALLSCASASCWIALSPTPLPAPPSPRPMPTPDAGSPSGPVYVARPTLGLLTPRRCPAARACAREYIFATTELAIDNDDLPTSAHTGFDLDGLVSNGMRPADCGHEDYGSALDPEENCAIG